MSLRSYGNRTVLHVWNDQQGKVRLPAVVAGGMSVQRIYAERKQGHEQDEGLGA